MRILGIDPGLQKTGWGVIDHSGSRLQYIASGLIKTDSKACLSDRLAELHVGLAGVLKNYTPETAAMEEIFLNKNPGSSIKLAHARGVLLAVPPLYGVETSEYSANTIKKSVVGVGHAAKNQMGMMIKTLLPACGQISEDEADALAVAITHAHHRKSVLIPAEASPSPSEVIPAQAGIHTKRGKKGYG